mmetsp:Transcript_12117/g.34059  ORF Transcript_12117/g.34059 Transcript_12117/m.34059 type:complete len:282 (-) Transcript_12117:1139-1984(-)
MEVGKLARDGLRHCAGTRTRELDRTRVLVHLRLCAQGPLLTPDLEGPAVEVDTVREDARPRPEGADGIARRHAQHRGEGYAASPPLRDGLGQIRDHRHVAVLPRRSEHCGRGAESVGEVHVKVRRHRAPRLIANELAHRREASLETPGLLALLELVLDQRSQQALRLKLRHLQSGVALALKEELPLDEVRQTLEEGPRPHCELGEDLVHRLRHRNGLQLGDEIPELRDRRQQALGHQDRAEVAADLRSLSDHVCHLLHELAQRHALLVHLLRQEQHVRLRL